MVYHTWSLKGMRASNEDKHVVIENNINYYAVYDGHGGKDVSTFLSNELHKYFFQKNISFENVANLRKNVNIIYDHIQNKLDKMYRNYSYTVGSTALIVIIYKNSLYVINLGDCRSILCNKNDQALPLSIDHKPNSDCEKKRIKNLGGKVYYDGYDWRVGNLSVSRAFGDIDSKPYVSHIPDINKYNLKKSDKFIVLACDGLWDVMTNNEVAKFVINELKNLNSLKNNSNNNNTNIAKKLAEHALSKGSTDNISLIIKFLNL